MTPVEQAPLADLSAVAEPPPLAYVYSSSTADGVTDGVADGSVDDSVDGSVDGSVDEGSAKGRLCDALSYAASACSETSSLHELFAESCGDAPTGPDWWSVPSSGILSNFGANNFSAC